MLRTKQVRRHGTRMSKVVDSVKFLQETYGVPGESLRIYVRLWELESWLREMVYVELKSARGVDWGASLKSVEEKFKQDKRLIHMATAERGPLSYMTLGELWEIMSSNWSLFEIYFPPKHLVEARITSELMQIRHRVAHCRTPHTDDLARVEQFAKDLDQSFWRFTTSYNDEHDIIPADSDLVSGAFIEDDQYPWCNVGDNQWTRLGRKDLHARYTITVARTIRPWVEKSLKAPIVPNPGVLYDVNLQVLDRASLDYEKILSKTKSFHDRCVHIILDSIGQSLRLTFSSLQPAQNIIEAVKVFRDVAYRVIRPATDDISIANRIAARWPEYVIGPSNPLCFLCPDMPCKFFPA